MISGRSLIALALLALVSLPAPAAADGPLDGAYLLSASAPGAASNDLFMVVLQNDTTVVLLVLDPLDSSWTFGVGTLDANGQVQGTLSFGDAFAGGSFRVRFQGGTVTGTVTLYEFTQSIAGSKIF
jgi:hypothetical protein